MSRPSRKDHEILHGARIADRAVHVWGWASPAGQTRARRRSGLLIRHGAVGPGRRVLELGCGTGLFSAALAAAGAEVVGIDISADLLARVRATTGSGSRPVRGDAESLPFPGGTFDAVVGSSVLHHLDPVATLREVFRVLRPGGRVCFAEPNMMNPQIALQKNIPLLKRYLGDSPDETAFFRWQAVRLLGAAGFTDALAIPHDFLHPAVPRVLIGPVRVLGDLLETVPLVRELAGSLVMAARKAA